MRSKAASGIEMGSLVCLATCWCFAAGAFLHLPISPGYGGWLKASLREHSLWCTSSHQAMNCSSPSAGFPLRPMEHRCLFAGCWIEAVGWAEDVAQVPTLWLLFPAQSWAMKLWGGMSQLCQSLILTRFECKHRPRSLPWWLMEGQAGWLLCITAQGSWVPDKSILNYVGGNHSLNQYECCSSTLKCRAVLKGIHCLPWLLPSGESNCCKKGLVLY